MKKVLGIGEIVLDKSCILDAYPKEDTKVVPLKVKYSLGGPVPTALIVLARLGVECTLLASVGEDTESQLVIRKLAQEGIRIIGPKKGKTKVNTYLINSQNGSRTGIRSEVKYAPIKHVPLDTLQEADIIIADRHEAIALKHAVQNKKPETKIIIDPSTEVSKKTLEMIKDSDVPVLPIESLDLIGGKSRFDGLKTLHSIANKNIVITAGEYGSFIYDGKEINLIPALKVKVIDRLGAGDVYRAGIAWGILQNWSLTKSALYANTVSGLQCTRYGNGTAIPSKNEIEEKFSSHILKKVDLSQLGLSNDFKTT